MLPNDVIQELAALRHDLVVQSIQQVQLEKKKKKMTKSLTFYFGVKCVLNTLFLKADP